MSTRIDPYWGRDQAEEEEADARGRAVETAITLTAGAWQTSLVSYLMQRDLFPSLVNVS